MTSSDSTNGPPAALPAWAQTLPAGDQRRMAEDLAAAAPQDVTDLLDAWQATAWVHADGPADDLTLPRDVPDGTPLPPPAIALRDLADLPRPDAHDPALAARVAAIRAEMQRADEEHGRR